MKQFEDFYIDCSKEEYPEVKAILEAQGYKMWGVEWSRRNDCVCVLGNGDFMTYVLSGVIQDLPILTLPELRAKYDVSQPDNRGIHTSHLTPLSEDIFAANKAKGFWDKPRELGTLLMLVTSELAEAMEADRKGSYATASLLDSMFNMDDERFKDSFEKLCKDTVEDEIADAIIRLFDLSGGRCIDIGKHIELKLRYNSLRPNKHGKLY